MSTSCSAIDTTNQVASDKCEAVAITSTKTSINDVSCSSEYFEESAVSDDETRSIDVLPRSSEDIVDYESYRSFISGVSDFEPYYQLVFDYGALAGGISNVPIDDVIAMCNELKTVFNFITIVSQRPLIYMGHYDGDTRFVYGYERYKSTGVGIGGQNPLNRVGRDRDGYETVTTPINTVIMCENSVSRFDNRVAEGRNLHMSDYSLYSQDEPISVVLGNAYRSIYKIGDILPLMYLHVVLSFEVVGFYESGVDFSMDAGALQDVNVDYSIIMPYFIPMYKPVGEDAVFQHGFHVAELTSGYIAISEPVPDINDDTHAKYMGIVEEIAKRHNLSGVYLSPLWPVGFVFPG